MSIFLVNLSKKGEQKHETSGIFDLFFLVTAVHQAGLAAVSGILRGVSTSSLEILDEFADRHSLVALVNRITFSLGFNDDYFFHGVKCVYSY